MKLLWNLTQRISYPVGEHVFGDPWPVTKDCHANRPKNQGIYPPVNKKD